MIAQGTYGDHVTLQRMSELFRINCDVISTQGLDFTIVISPNGHYNEDIPTIILGYFPEGMGEHYVCLDGSLSDFHIGHDQVYEIKPDVNEESLNEQKMPQLQPEQPRDQREDRRDQCEDRRDQREDRRDQREDTRDQREDTRDQSEDTRDQREDTRDQREDTRDQREDRRDQREDRRDQREDTPEPEDRRDRPGDKRDQREHTRDQREDTRDQREDTRDQREDTRYHPEEKLCFLPTEILKIIIDNVLNIDLSYGLSLRLVSRSFAHMVQLYMECVSPARRILYRAESIHIRDSLQMELGIYGQHHHMLSVCRLMTTAGKFSGLANVVRKLPQQIDKQWYSSWITIVPDGCTGWFRITSVHWKNGNLLHI